MQQVNETTEQEVAEAVRQSGSAFAQWARLTPEERRPMLLAVAAALERAEEKLVALAAKETHLLPDRLKGELKRTVLQWRSYADGAPELIRSLSRTDPGPPLLVKRHIPLGPVAVFGASNFPFAYATAGGDTASALAAGCTVVVKGHPAHPLTSEACASLIREALQSAGAPEGILLHLPGSSHELSSWLVTHPGIAAVGFTGSIRGGRQLFDWAAARPQPVPVFAEMGSTNPVVLLPGALRAQGPAIAEALVSSITGSSGQFCTKPGLLLALEGGDTERFAQVLVHHFEGVAPAAMLHQGIAQSFVQGREAVLNTEGIQVLSTPPGVPLPGTGHPLLARIPARHYLRAPHLAEELFGPYSLLVTCSGPADLQEVISRLGGQLTASLYAGLDDAAEEEQLLPLLERKAGRIIRNGVPTGVSVSPAMHHGGPYPAATDARFTAVGTDALLRWLRPVTYQNFPAV